MGQLLNAYDEFLIQRRGNLDQRRNPKIFFVVEEVRYGRFVQARFPTELLYGWVTLCDHFFDLGFQ